MSSLSEMSPIVTALQITLQRGGWTITLMDVNHCSGRVDIELRRDDLVVTFRSTKHSTTTTRERIRTESVLVGRRGDRYRADRLRTEFVGRTHHEGLRSGLRWLSVHIAENSKSLSVGDVRRALSPLTHVVMVVPSLR